MAKYNLESLNSFLENGEEDGISGFIFETVETDFDITPNEFLNFAKHDFTAKYDHHLVNSLSNVKRAIDSQLDSLLFGFGLSERAKKWNFPTKIDFLNSIGVVSPGILKKINTKRNLLEHEYRNPTEEEVEDALDVAELFIKYTDKYLIRALKFCDVFSRGEGYITITLDWENCKITSTYRIYEDDKFKKTVTEELTNASQKEYGDYLKFYLKLYNYL
ncbi:hypothetical protein [Methanosarcina sp.]|uniref:hypothetical protein n=1 Tax=Methanosarcina sp. TaxID=2213 RepID=UPI003C74CEAB